MHDPQVIHPADRAVLESYKTLVEGLAGYLGDGYEIVPTASKTWSIWPSRWRTATTPGRRRGLPSPTSPSPCSAASPKKRTAWAMCATMQRTIPARAASSTTISIQGQGGKVIGPLCINLYLDTPSPTARGAGRAVGPARPPTSYLASSRKFRGQYPRIGHQSGRAGGPAGQKRPHHPPHPAQPGDRGLLHAQGIFNMKDAVPWRPSCWAFRSTRSTSICATVRASKRSRAPFLSFRQGPGSICRPGPAFYWV